eukprot:scaffold62787_cov64-Phaeocystis_antarctica.AAC.2
MTRCVRFQTETEQTTAPPAGLSTSRAARAKCGLSTPTPRCGGGAHESEDKAPHRAPSTPHSARALLSSTRKFEARRAAAEGCCALALLRVALGVPCWHPARTS